MNTIAAVVTGFDSALYSIIEEALKAKLPDVDYKLLTFANPNLIAQTLEAGKVTENVAKELTASYLAAVNCGADVILSVCSTMGDVAEAAQPLFEKLGVPIVRIDERMMRFAVHTYRRIAFVATCDAIMLPNRNLMEKTLRREKTGAEVTYYTLDRMQGKPGPEASAIAVEELLPHKGSFDAVVMTQASMAPLTAAMEQALGVPVLSSSGFGAAEVAEILAG
ncbi:MAG: aspartate/glutamate racemase family protein [Oscillospiraceae bacterium]|nr:aspartate/glutamate racemase family protein [Oscillospiraceae bacterium]